MDGGQIIETQPEPELGLSRLGDEREKAADKKFGLKMNLPHQTLNCHSSRRSTGFPPF
jgi:hypothetical protein